ncbi:MAG: potassium-transporting ATPase subunit KdpC [Paenibacillus dendritiformis]|uniref:potassium-transporting ATPase subunit KdpC n=2 Tax=uncultured Paenibacillus sp. TaxID=227322 RepID=UPI0025D03800|nr:potassium-transporting ATPase subunit KdpC [uncultured Paenibacillus sp.]MDU5143781.1 potassium-transporting ATPase subunit KdpC [Paenibacillus dendritiformis]
MMNHSVQATQEQGARSGAAAVISMARLSVVFIVLCGIVYPLACTGLLQALVPERANGSLIRDGSGAVIGSQLIGQPIDDPRYFHGRVSSIGYQAEASGSNNYAPSNPELLERMKASVRDWERSNPAVPAAQLPIDLVTNSASGLDPHITPEAARVQIPRISGLTGIAQAELEKLVGEHTEGRDLGLFGEPRVNVLALNLDLRALLNR